MWTLQRSPAVIRDDYGPRSLTLHRMSREEIDEDKRFEKYAVSLKADMVSRRKILSRSRDDLNLDPYPVEEEEDVWQQKDKLYKDHIQEILDKWNSIDDEIWAKVIVMERNRRVAKAYARAPVLTVNGSDDGFDGFRIGLCGFDNPMRDAKGEEVKRHIGNGVKVKMDDAGNILIKRISKTNVYVKNTVEENSVSNDILKLPNGALEMEKPVKLFDMKKFQQNVSRELKRAYPDRRKLETQCICSVAFVKNETEVLECPIWVMFINVVAMDMLKSKMPPVAAPGKRSADIRNRPRIPIPDEDPYSIAGSGSSGSSGNGNNTSNTSGNKRNDKPPKLPPRDNGIYGQNIPKPDYDEVMDENGFKAFQSSRTSKDSKNDKKYDDPYYCGLRARIPNFAKSKGKDKEEKNNRHANNGTAAITGPLPHPHYGQPMMWHSRSFDSGMASMGGNGVSENHRLWNPTTWVPQSHAYLPAHHDSDFTESAYSRIYGRLPIPRSYVPIAPTRVYHGEWN